MPPNLFSRLVPSSSDDLPWYEQARNEPDPDPDPERQRQDLVLDEENLTHQFHEDDLERAHGLALEDSHVSSTRSPDRTARSNPRRTSAPDRNVTASRWLSREDDGDNDVPASLLVEGPGATTRKTPPRRSGPQPSRHPAIPGPSNRRLQAQWETAQAQQRLHPDEEAGPLLGQDRAAVPHRRHGLDANPRDKAMFRWANVSNLDVFIRDVYDYYLGAGIWCILLDRLLHLL